MTSKTRSFRILRNPIGCLILLAAFAAAAGCSTAETPGGSATNMNHVLSSGSSVSGWLVTPSGGTHANSATLDYIANNGSSGCTECHGSDLKGGISGVSCFTPASGCHHGPVPGWVAISPAAQQHGVSAKKAPGSSGFASCQICHGSDFSGGGANIRCSFCHVVNAPHPSAPWRGSPYTHTNTNTANAPVCYQCHAYTGTANPNNPHLPPSPAPAGTAPGCFNGTMCHNEATVPHPVGATWVTTAPAAQPHGNSAKATPGSTSGFDYCKVCHGTGNTFTGGTAVSCYPCHGNVGTPHPSQWRTGDTYVHTTTAGGNAPVCAFCHTAGANSPIPPPPAPAPGAQPDCFNNTLCHGAGGASHPVPYNDNSHYAVTSATFPGSCSACHDVSAPSAKAGPVCQTCHVAASPLAAPGTCTSCHASPPDSGAPAGSVYPNIAGTHAVHLGLNTPANPNGSPVSCDTCHTGLTSRTLNHYNLAKTRVPPGDVAFLATYNAQSGASSFISSVLICGNVSCHGGTSPNWRTGVIDVNADCTICHKSATISPSQYNDYYSGEHSRHIGAGILCAECHDMSAATTGGLNHFNYLSTTSVRDLGVNTVSTTFRSGTATGITYTAPTAIPGTGRCSGSCHGTGHNNEAWSIPR